MEYVSSMTKALHDKNINIPRQTARLTLRMLDEIVVLAVDDDDLVDDLVNDHDDFLRRRRMSRMK